MMPFVPLLVILPLGAAFCVVAMAQVNWLRRLTAPLAMAVVLANLVISAMLFGFADIRFFVGGWGPGSTIGIELVCDGLSKLMAVTVNLVSLVAFVFAVPYMRRFTKVWLFDSLLLLMVGAMNGVVLAGDLFNLFVFLEIAAIASYALVAFGCEAEELEAAFKYMVLGTVGSAFILLGVTVIYSLTGQLNMALVHSLLGKVGPGGPAVLLAAALLLSGLALKAAMVPFHAWLPDAHPSAPAPISAMLSGVLIKASGVYVMARVVFNVFGASDRLAAILMAMGTLSMLIGVLLAVGQWDIKRLLAYHSISQMGYVVLAIGAAAQVAARPSPDMALAGLCLFGGLFHLFNHAMFKSLLFLSSGAIEQQTGTRELKKMGGLARRMKVTSFCCRVGALSIAGVPPFNGFFSKLIIIVALVLAGHEVLAALAVFVALVTLISFIKVQRYALEGAAAADRAANAVEAPVLMQAAMVVLAVLCIVSGLAIVPLRQHVLGPAADALLGAGRLLSTGGAP